MKFFQNEQPTHSSFQRLTKKGNEIKLTPVEKYKKTIKGMATNIFSFAKKHTRERHGRKNIEFTLTKNWVLEKLEKGICEVTNLPFGAVKKRSLRPSIDRIDPKKGYTPENCQMVLFSYNAAKSINTHEDVMKLAKALVKRYPTPKDKIEFVDASGNPIGGN